MSLLFPNGYKCLVCGKEIDSDKKLSLCDKCLNKLPKINGSVCFKCGEPVTVDSKYCVHCKKELPEFTKCFAPYIFDGDVISLIHGLKYNGKIYYARTLSNLMLQSVLEQNIDVDVVIPVPLNLRREGERGFNQSELLTVAFSEAGYKVDLAVVTRSKNTATQTHLTKKERKQNVEDAFVVTNKSKVKGKNVLLVDDVFTTGATINAIAKVLKLAGAKNVYGVTFAHTIIK